MRDWNKGLNPLWRTGRQPVKHTTPPLGVRRQSLRLRNSRRMILPVLVSGNAST